MAYIHTVAPHEAEGDVLAMYERQQLAWGHVPNYARVFSARPQIMARWASLLAGIRGPMDARRFELVTLAAAAALRNSYCCLAHGNALRAFCEDEAIAAIVSGQHTPLLTPAENEMVQFARKVAGDAAAVTPADIEGLRSHGLTDAEIFDIVATVAGRAFFTKLLDALGAEPDSTFMNMRRPLRDALVVGRAVSRTPTERIGCDRAA